MWFWKCLIVNFEDWISEFMGKIRDFTIWDTIKGLEWMRLDFELILLGFRNLEGLNFGVSVWMNLLIVIPGNKRLLLVFATSILAMFKTTKNKHFWKFCTEKSRFFCDKV